MTSPSQSVRVLQLQTDVGIVGGIATYISELIRSPAVRTCSFLVTVANPVATGEAAKSLYGEKPVIVEMPASYSLWSLPGYIRRLRVLLRVHQIDVVHAHAVRSALAAAVVTLLDGIPLVYTNHGLRYTQKTSAPGKLIFLLMEWFVCRIAAVVCAIRRFDYEMLSNFPMGGARKLRLVETRIRAPLLAVAQEVAPNKGMQTKEGPPWRVVGIGSLIDVKRPDRFLSWVKALRDAEVNVSATWIGDGPLRGVIEQRAEALGLPITFLGHQPREQVFHVLATAHLLLLTSKFEVFPFAVLEAYSQGIPVISSRFAGAEDFIDPGRTGLLVDADNPDEVAQLVAALLQDESRLDEMSRAAQTEFVRRFNDPNVMARAYAKIYSDVAVDFLRKV